MTRDEAIAIWKAFYVAGGGNLAAMAVITAEGVAGGLTKQEMNSAREKALERHLFNTDLPPTYWGIPPTWKNRIRRGARR